MWRFQTLCFVNPPFYLLFLDLKDAMYVFCFIGTLEIPVHFLFVVFWFVRQINCEMNIKREIEASVINHLLALSLCQCHYTHTHARGNRKRIHMCLYIRDHTCFYDVSNGGTVRQNTLHDAITEMSHKWHAIIKVSVCMCVWLHGRICSNITLTCTTCKVILLCCQ